MSDATNKTPIPDGWRDGWLDLWKANDPFYTDYIDATHIGIYERPMNNGDRARIVKVFAATDENIQKAEDFCAYGKKHEQDLNPKSSKRVGMKVAAMLAHADEYAAKVRAERGY